MRSAPNKIWLTLALLTWGGTAVPLPAWAQTEHPNVLVILVDALRADHLGCYGYERPTSPTIDDLAARSVVFENAQSPTSWTKPSVASLFTGLHPVQHGVFIGETRDEADRITSDVLRADHTTLAEVFQASGYSTAAFVHNVQISSFMGFDQGFDLYAEELGDAANITDRCLEWLGARRSRPFFAYVHYLDVHWPYTPPAKYVDQFVTDQGSVDFETVNWKYLERQIKDGELELAESDVATMRSLYDAEIKYVDDSIARILEALRESGLDEKTIVVFTADHGEEFLEHGGVGHGRTLFQELLQIPLVIHVPNVKPQRLAAPVQLTDVMPTVVDLAALRSPGGLAGQKLQALWDGTAEPVTPQFADLRNNGRDRAILQSLTGERFKLIRTFAKPNRVSTSSDVPAPNVHVGDWLEVEGVLREDGSFLAVEIEPMESRDELRLSGPITTSAYPVSKSEFHLLGMPCQLLPGARFKDDADNKLEGVELANGDWMQVRGNFNDNDVFEVKRVQFFGPNKSPRQEIKAMVDEVRSTADGFQVFRMSHLEVGTDSDTQFDGDWTGRRPVVEAAGSVTAKASDASADPEARALADIELYDLRADRAESSNIADVHREVVQAMMTELDRWEARYGVAAGAPAAVELDAETIERLRALGYIN